MTASTVVVDGCPIHVRTAGASGDPLVLLHGGGGHTHWWDDVVAALGDRRVVLMDFSGHGDSGHRDAYLPVTWADEIAAVVREHAGGRAVVVGHSMGGRIAALAASRHPERIAAAVLVDSAVPLAPDDPWLPSGKPNRAYPTQAAAVERFRLMPPEPPPAPELLQRLARRSVVEGPDGWSWKFDPRVFARLPDQAPEQGLAAIRCPVALIHGEHSAVTEPALALALEGALGRPVPLLTVAGAHHHLPLSSPQTLAALLRWLPETR